MQYSLSFNRLFIGFEKWKGPKEEGLYNNFMCIYSELSTKCEGSMNSFSNRI